MRYTILTMLLLMMLSICFGTSCRPNPKRPSRMTQQELNSSAYDKFFDRFGPRIIEDGKEKIVRRTGAMIYTNKTEKGLVFDGGKAAAGAYKAIDSQMVLGIYFDASTKTDPPPMQLQILARRELPDGGLIGEYGDPVVLCNLNARECSLVLEDGIPQALIDAMVTEAKNAKWKPTLPRPQQFGGFRHVDPVDFFPTENKTE